MSLSGRLHSMASGSFRDAKLERPVSGAELRRLLVASRPVPASQWAPKRTPKGQIHSRGSSRPSPITRVPIAQRIDEQGKCGSVLAPTRVIQVIPGHLRRPIGEHTLEPTFRQMVLHHVLG